VGQFRKFVVATDYQTTAELAGFAFAVSGNTLRRVDGGNWRNAVDSRRTQDGAAVVGVSYRDAEQYCRWNRRRLPTEDEWEYVARGPMKNVFPWGDDVAAAVTSMSAQPLAGDGPAEGIAGASRGMSGNVWEWVDTEVDGRKVLKGGSWMEASPSNRRAAARRYELPLRADADSGFRCAASAPAWPDAAYWLAQLN
jgi:formylglycine-generating enzyme required for sulfatase activity